MSKATDREKKGGRRAWSSIRKAWTKEARLWRYGIQALIFVFVTWVAIGHQRFGGGVLGVPSVEAYCPFGAIEGLYHWVVTGTFMQRVSPSAFVVFAALVAVTILTRKAFCSWLCPFGTIQEWFGKLGKRIFRRRYNPTGAWDRALRPLKYLVLVGIVAITWTTGTMAFREYDPFLAFFHFGLNFSEHWIGNTILIAVLVGSLVIERFWCRYLCPLGAVIGMIGKAGPLGIRRNAASCTLCEACNRICPVKAGPMEAGSLRSAECLQCMACVSVCPEPHTLRLGWGRWNLRPAVFAITVLVVFFGVLTAGRATGLWVTAGQGSLTDAYGRLDPAGVRGWMSLEYIAKGYRLDLRHLRQKSGLPDRVDREIPIKQIAGKYGLPFDPHKVRAVVGELLREKGVAVAESRPAAAGKALDADKIRGTWTLRELVEKSGISKGEFARGVGFPADTPGEEKLLDIVRPLGKSVELFREMVRQKASVPKMPGLHPEQIRGYWTLKELILQSGIPGRVFAEKIGFPPDTPEDTKLRDIVRPLGKEVEEFRNVVQGANRNP